VFVTPTASLSQHTISEAMITSKLFLVVEDEDEDSKEEEEAA
jgi:hypothetical protein